MLAAALVIVTVAAYLPAVKAGFIWDDDAYVWNNQTLRSVEGLTKIWFRIKATPQYYPLVHTSYWLEYRLWKINPAGYHTVNILLHIISAVLFWRILTVLGLPQPGALLAAAIFALHPVHVESVAWITERKNVLSGVFYLGAALTYLRYALAPINEPDKNRSRWFYIISLVLFVGALLSKTVTCSLPAALLLVLWWKREHIGWDDMRGLIPFFALGIVFGLLTAWIEKQHVGAVGEEWNLSFIGRCLVAGRALCFYADKLLWPSRLTFIYPRWNIDSVVWRQYLYPAAVISVIAAFWLVRKRIGKAPLVAVLFFIVTLFPALGFFNVYPMRFSFVADHFQYLAGIGIISLVTAAGCRAAVRLDGRIKYIVIPFAFLILTALGTLVWRQCYIYKNAETLWRDTLLKNPDAWMAHINLGSLRVEQGKFDEAVSHYVRALRLLPNSVALHNSLADALILQGKLDEAISHYHQAIQIAPSDGMAYYNLGTIFQSQGKLDEAVSYYRRALQAEPDYAKAYNNLAIVLLAQGKSDEAVSHYRMALQFAPDNADIHYNLGVALQSQGKLDEAIDRYRKAVALAPDSVDAHYNLGVVLASQGRLDEAIGCYRKALELKPDFLPSLSVMAQILIAHPDPNLRDADEAAAFAERAAEVSGYKDAAILEVLSDSFAAAGLFDRAVAAAQKALELATAAGDNEMAEHLRRKIELYGKAKP